MEEWKEYQLKDATTVLGDGLHGTPKYDENGTVFFINGNNLVDGKIEIKESTKRVSEDEANKYKKNLNSRTILVSINGTIGNVAKYQGEACILGKSACYFNVSEDFDLNFIYYVVASKQFKNSITHLSTGTTIKNVSLETMRNYSFAAPSINEQKRIAELLSSLDDKIELNRRINDNLEQQAQALFKSWFVDFEPFRDGEFVDSGLGMI
ncbi:restriction endonuclease subunit S, partial [Bacteroides caecimuris]|uniref:restriction endonuclease subunit S n=1 Tax=Bacteroides caecimuris TaxID=1796613 RepID=UPI001C3CEC55